ncbi:hypothetical protein PO909_029054 [Leuciscus waleckii]
MDRFQIPPPPKFDFTKPEEWPKWIRRFERFRIASGLELQPDENQVNTLIYTMGDEAEDIVTSLRMTEEEASVYNTVKEKLERHFVVRRNIIFERAKFNQRQQEQGETVDSFITALHCLSEHCGYGHLHDEMVRDRLVVGLRDKKLSEQLQLDSELTLESTVSSDGEPWLINLKVNEHTAVFKIDTGADVTVLSEDVFQKWEFPALGLVARVDTVALDSVERVKEQFPALFKGLGKMEGEYKIELKADGKPFSISTPRRIPLPLMSKVKKELTRMEEMGVISRVEQPTDWCAGMVTVPKPGKDEVRICVDLTKLNESVKRERHMLPSVEHTLGQLEGAKLFSKIDANSGFWQIPLAKESALLTTFLTPFGRFCFNRLCFGISSAPEHYQKRMSQILEGLDGVLCQMDDVLVYGDTQAQHDTRLLAVLGRLQEAGVTLRGEKCEFSKSHIKFLGQIIDAAGVRADPNKVRAVTDMEEQKTQPLRDLLKTQNVFQWGHDQQRAFNSIKEELSTPPGLALYNAKAETVVSADASSFGLGAVLLQRQEDGHLKPVAYSSRALTDTEKRYAQIEKEALAITWACERFSDFLVGITFHVETDHKPLVPLLGSKSLDELPPRIQRLRMRLMAFSFSISHVAGKKLATADVLSRAPLRDRGQPEQEEEVNLYVNMIMSTLPATEKRLQEIREHQERDEILSQVSDHVWVKDTKEKGTVIRQAEAPRSYVIDTPRGNLRRNRNHLVSTPVAPAAQTTLPDHPTRPSHQTILPEPEQLTGQPVRPDHAGPGPVQPCSPEPPARYPARERRPPGYLKDFVAK